MDTITEQSRAGADFELPAVLLKYSTKNAKKRSHTSQGIVLNNADYKLIAQLAGEGLSRTSIAQVLRMSDVTFNKILQRDPLAIEALDRGYSGDLQLITNTLRNHALDGNIHHIKAYLHVQHGLIVGEDSNKAQGLQINVQMPFPVANTGGEVYDANS